MGSNGQDRKWYSSSRAGQGRAGDRAAEGMRRPRQSPPSAGSYRRRTTPNQPRDVFFPLSPSQMQAPRVSLVSPSISNTRIPKKKSYMYGVLNEVYLNFFYG